MRVLVRTPPDERSSEYAFDGAVGWTTLEDHSLDVEYAPGRHLMFKGGTWSSVEFEEAAFAPEV